MKKLTFLIFILFIALGCNNKEEHNITTIPINFDHNTEPLSLFELSYLKLDTLRTLGDVDMIDNDSDYIYILDKTRGNRSLSVYDLNGDFKATLGREGRGPGEFINPSSFNVGSDFISTYDVEQGKMIFYNKNDFSLKKEQKVPFYTSGCKYISDNSIVWSNDSYMNEPFSDYYYVTTDSLFNIKEGYIKKIIKTGYLTGPTVKMYKNEKTFRAFTPFLPFIYNISSDGIAPEYEINFGNTTLPPSSFLKEINKKGNYFSQLEKSEYISYYNITETSTTICISYICNNERFINFYNKLTKKSYAYNRNEFKNKMNLSSSFVVGVLKDKFVIPLYDDTNQDRITLCLFDFKK